MYIKNTSDNSWIVPRVFYNIAASTNGVGDMLARVLKNVTAGTVISAGTDFVPINFNFGVPNALEGDFKTGVETSTATADEAVSTLIPAAGTRVLIPLDSVILPIGATAAIEITPPTSNTSMDVQVGFNIHELVL